MPDVLLSVMLIVMRSLLLVWLIGAAILLAEKLASKQSIPSAEFVLDSIMGAAFALSMGWLD